MKNIFSRFVVFVLYLSFLQIPVLEAEPNNPDSDKTKQVKAVVITCKDMIDDGLYKSIKRRTNTALDAGTEYLIYEVDTYGGDLFAAFNISNYILQEVNPKANTVAYVSQNAISAGAMISVACKDIVMEDMAQIGDCAPIQLQGELTGVKREKVETVTRTTFATAAQANGYPEMLLKAMVTMQLEVYMVKNLKTGKNEFFDADRLPKDPNEYDLENKELIVKEDELLTLTAAQALDYGVARAKVNNLQDVLDFLAKRDGVTFMKSPATLEPNWSEQMVRWINSPAVMSILVLLALLGVYMELNTPGVGLPGLVALICFVIIIGSKYLIGLANWVEVAIFITGVLLLLIEILVLPGFGIAGTLGIIFIIGGAFGMLVRNPPDRLPWPQTPFDWQLFKSGALGLSLGFLAFIVVAWLFAKFLPKMQFLSGLILTPATAKKGDEFEINMTAPPQSRIPRLKPGDIGQVLSTLRPTGKARFAEAIVDVVAEADFIETGCDVMITEIHGNRVVVKAVEN